jgi:hypothetical protein
MALGSHPSASATTATASASGLRLAACGVSKNEALEKLAVLQAKARTSQPLEVEKLTVGQFLERWLQSKRQSVGDTTADRYEQHIRLTLARRIGAILLPKLAKFHVEQT